MKNCCIKILCITVDNREYFGVAPSIEEAVKHINELSDNAYSKLFSSSDRNYEIEEEASFDNYESRVTFDPTDLVGLWFCGAEVPCKFFLNEG